MPKGTARLVAKLTTCDDQLPQGAPTSTALGEFVLFPVDVRLSGLAESTRLVYSRYVDDITLSGGERLSKSLINRAMSIIVDAGWEVNVSKTTLAGPDQRHLVLGIVVNRAPTTTREYYDGIRRLLRFLIRKEYALSEAHQKALRGKISWVGAVDPSRGAVLARLLDAYLERLAAT